jgi:hypothetical protein
MRPHDASIRAIAVAANGLPGSLRWPGASKLVVQILRLVPADGVNIAARLEGIAKPGTICLSEDAYRQVSGRRDGGHRSARPNSRTSTGRFALIFAAGGVLQSRSPATSVNLPNRDEIRVLRFQPVAARAALVEAARHKKVAKKV